MTDYLIFNSVKGLSKRVQPVSLISAATPLHTIDRFAKVFGQKEILIKREDLTDSRLYGGNKVRNLEFVLGEALHCGFTQVSTLIAYGSNFTAALAAQSQKLGLRLRLSQFVMERNLQIEAHVKFAKNHNAIMTTFDRGLASLPLAAADAFIQACRPNTYFIQPGASTVLGAIGHANALLEAINQIEKSKTKMPDRIFVGAGTCGTIAGLMVGVILSGKKIAITGVRCADPLVCNPRRVAKLVNKTLHFLGVKHRIRHTDVHIVDSAGPKNYAQTSAKIFDVMDRFEDLEGIKLDSTYTAKVILALIEALLMNRYGSERLLYWHTFSSKAMYATATPAAAINAAAPRPLTLITESFKEL